VKSYRVEFQNDAGHILSGRLEMPVDENPVDYALFAHCFTCSKDYKAITYVSRALAERGIAVLRFDFTGLGESEGEFSDTNFSSNVEDLVAAARFLEEDYEAPRLLVGHSLGGAAVLQAAVKIPSSRSVVTIAAPCSPKHLERLVTDRREELVQKGEIEVSIAGRPFRIKKQFVDDLDALRMDESIRDLDRALLVMHSPADRTVDIENAYHIFETARHPKSFVSLDKADHLLLDPDDARYAGGVIAAWAEKNTGRAKATAAAEASEDGAVVVRTGADRYHTDVRVRGHGLVADEPEKAGGTNHGASPYELLLAALGACTSITLRMYADRKGWPLEAVEVRLRHHKVHAKDCESCETESGMIDVIDREVNPLGDLTEEQRQRLLEIADKCPVHKTLHSNEVKVNSTLK
jgi:putative redox protein